MILSKRSKILLIFTIIIILVATWIIHLNNKIYNSVFRLSYEEIENSLKEVPTKCNKLTECELLPGDIIIRRYITERTREFDEFLHPYFTHSAIYLGGDELFEALGTDETPVNQIQITKLSESDWLKDDMNNFVIIRSKNYFGKLDQIILNLKDIANDPEYTFGPIQEGRKTVSCSDIILKNLETEKIVDNTSIKPEIITPDYLFFVLQNYKSNFEIIGYNINPKN